MSPQPRRFSKQNRTDEPARGVEPPTAEKVITLATSADRQRLRGELLRLILRSESMRKRARQDTESQELTTTEGSAEPMSKTSKA